VAAEASEEASGQWRLWRREAGERRVAEKQDDVDLTKSGLGNVCKVEGGGEGWKGQWSNRAACRERPSSPVALARARLRVPRLVVLARRRAKPSGRRHPERVSQSRRSLGRQRTALASARHGHDRLAPPEMVPMATLMSRRLLGHLEGHQRLDPLARPRWWRRRGSGEHVCALGGRRLDFERR
jgi:hypothetical protein